MASSPQIIEGALLAFLICYAEAYPKLQVKLTEVKGWAATAAKLESDESHLGQILVGAVPPDHACFACRPLEAIELLAVFNLSLRLEPGGAVEIGQLGPVLHPVSRRPGT